VQLLLVLNLILQLLLFLIVLYIHIVVIMKLLQILTFNFNYINIIACFRPDNIYNLLTVFNFIFLWSINSCVWSSYCLCLLLNILHLCCLEMRIVLVSECFNLLLLLFIFYYLIVYLEDFKLPLSCPSASLACIPKILIFLSSKTTCVICFRRFSFNLVQILLFIIFHVFILNLIFFI
jgi:hypothetical protein